MPKKIMLLMSEAVHPDAAKAIRQNLEKFIKSPANSISILGGVPGDIKALVIDSEGWTVEIVTGQPKPEPKRTARKKETPA